MNPKNDYYFQYQETYMLDCLVRTYRNFFRLGSAISPSKKAKPSLKKLREVQTGIMNPKNDDYFRSLPCFSTFFGPFCDPLKYSLLFTLIQRPYFTSMQALVIR